MPTLRQRVLDQNVPFLGVCVGMQLLAAFGYEHETSAGLGWVPGSVRALPRPADGKIPHMGWNNVQFTAAHPLFRNIASDAHFYFVHSYHFITDQPAHVLAHCVYGQPFAAAVGHGNICGTQFHPEKSQALGIKLLANFVKWAP